MGKKKGKKKLQTMFDRIDAENTRLKTLHNAQQYETENK